MGAITNSRASAIRRETFERKDLEVYVVFTGVSATLEALQAAAELAVGLAGRIRLIVPHVVPYPLPLNAPAIRPAWLERRFRILVEQARVDTTVDIRLCRDPGDALQQVLPPRSIVVIGGRSRLAARGAVRLLWSRWWPTREQRMAVQLSEKGHHVLFPGANEASYA